MRGLPDPKDSPWVLRSVYEKARDALSNLDTANAILGASVAALKRERDEWRASAAGYSTDAEQYKHERDEAIALLQEVREWHRCPWKHGASVEVIDLQLHAAWIARLDAALGGRDE